MTQLKKLLVALTPMGAAAYVAGGGTFRSLSELAHWAERPSFRPRNAAAKSDPIWRTKKALLLMMAVGAAGYLGFSGTFANFSAETANNQSSIASGTLTMSNTVNTGTACLSANAPSTDNISGSCDAAFAATNVAPGVFSPTQIGKIVVTNTGSIDASNLYLYASQVNGKLLTQVTSGQTGIISLALTTSSPTGLEGTVATNDSIVVSYGGHSQTFTASAPAAGGATSISVNSATALFTFPAGSTVTDTSGNTTPSNTDCFDAKTTSSPIVGATVGTSLNFNPIAGNPFCGSVVMWIQEIGASYSYCWFGRGSIYSTGGEDANGRCVAPISVTTSGISGTISSIPLAAGTVLNGNVKVGDQILVTQGTHKQTFTAATSAETYGASSIAITPSSVVTSPFTSGAVVTDTSAQALLDSNLATDNVTAFQTAHHLSAGKLELYPLSNNGAIDNTSGAAELTHMNSGTYTRTFYVGVYLPVPGGSNQNAIQGLSSTFGLTWHLSQ